jgi:hypothetical protein
MREREQMIGKLITEDQSDSEIDEGISLYIKDITKNLNRLCLLDYDKPTILYRLHKMFLISERL